jgi:hypothetical protein
MFTFSALRRARTLLYLRSLQHTVQNSEIKQKLSFFCAKGKIRLVEKKVSCLRCLPTQTHSSENFHVQIMCIFNCRQTSTKKYRYEKANRKHSIFEQKLEGKRFAVACLIFG